MDCFTEKYRTLQLLMSFYFDKSFFKKKNVSSSVWFLYKYWHKHVVHPRTSVYTNNRLLWRLNWLSIFYCIWSTWCDKCILIHFELSYAVAYYCAFTWTLVYTCIVTMSNYFIWSYLPYAVYYIHEYLVHM